MNRNDISAYLEEERQRKRRRLRFKGEPGAAKVGVVFSWVPALKGGHGPYVLSLESGALPNGLAIVGNTLAGTPTVPASFTFWLKITDARLDTHSSRFTIAVDAA